MRLRKLNWLSRLLPPRLRRRELLTAEQRRELLSGVGDHDACLRAVLDILQEALEQEFMVVIDPTRSAEQKLRAMEGLRRAYHTLNFLEQERMEAIEWKRKQNP